jgi:membrane-associated phospholipid phosphatase
MLGLLSHRRHLWLLLLYPLVGLGFSACEALVPVVVHAMEWQPVDGWIPFVPWMVWPYVFWYLSIAFALGWTGWFDGREFRRLVAFLYLGMTSAFVVYLLFPNGQNLRPALDSLGQGWDNDVLRWLYTHDTPTNCNPSIHVIDAVGVWIALARDRVLGPKRWFQAGLAFLSLAIIASTVLVKQHSIVDVFGGLAWSGIWYVLIYSHRSPFFRFQGR